MKKAVQDIKKKKTELPALQDSPKQVQKKYFLIVAFTAILARILFFLADRNSPLFLYPVIDEKEFVNNAMEIARGHFSYTWYFWHPPGYTYFLALLFSTGFSLKMILLVQYILGVAGALFLYHALEKPDRKAAFITALIWAVYPVELFTETRFLSENLFNFLAILLCWMILRFEKKTCWFILTGLVTSLLIITKTQFLLFLLVAAPLLFFYYKASFRNTIIYTGFALLMPVFATVHNVQKTGGNIIFVSANGPVNLYIGNSCDIKKTLNIRPYEWREKFFPGLYEEAGIKIFKTQPDSGETYAYKLSKFLVGKTKKANRNPVVFLKNVVLKTFILLHSDETPRNYDLYEYRKINHYLYVTVFRNPFRLPMALFYYAALLFIILKFKRILKDRNQVWFLIIILIALLPSVLFFNAFRYRLAAIPFLLFFAVKFYREYGRNIRVQLINVAAVIVLGTGIFNKLLIQQIPLFETYDFYGDGYLKKNQPEKAEKFYRMAIAAPLPDSNFMLNKYQLLMNMGIARQEAGDNQAAMDFYKQASAFKKDEYKPYLYLAALKSLNNENSEAIVLYNKVIGMHNTIKPDLVKATYERGLCKGKMNDLKGAIADFDDCLKQDPSYSKAWSDRGVIKARLMDYNGAFNDFNTAIRLMPADYKAWFNRAGVKAGTGDFQGAMADLDKAIELNSDYAEAFLMRGLLKIQSGRRPEGCQDLQKSASLGNKEAVIRKEKLCM